MFLSSITLSSDRNLFYQYLLIYNPQKFHYILFNYVLILSNYVLILFNYVFILSNYKMNDVKCPSCGNTQVITDHVHGESFCRKCGLVIADKLFDFGPEWRAFDREDADKRSRTGGPLKFGKLTKGLTTEIDKYDRDIKGKAIPVEKKAKWYRLRRWQKRSRMATSLQRNLSIALPELDRMCSYLTIASNMKEECARLYRKCASEGLVKGRSIESMVAAVIYIVTRQHHSPVTLEDLEQVSGRAKKDIGKSYRKIAQGFNLKIPTAGAIDYVPRFAIKLNASGRTLAKARDIVIKATALSIISGKVPISVAAAAVYLAGHTLNDGQIPKKIQGFPGTTRSTIKERYEDLKMHVVDKEIGETEEIKESDEGEDLTDATPHLGMDKTGVEAIVQLSPVKIDKDQNLNDALDLMEKKHISRLLVTDEGWVVGIITEEDLVNRLASAKERKLKTTQIHVSSAMTKELIVIPLTADFMDAAKAMIEHGFSSLPVVEEDEIIGLITKTDLVKKLLHSEKKVKDFYSKKPLLTNPANTIVSARKIMLKHNINRLIVTNKGMLTGILTRRDLAEGFDTFRKALDYGKHPDIKGLKVEHVMSKDPITITPETTVGEAVAIMLKNKISGLPVITQDYGILTKTDLVKGIADEKLP